MKRNFSFGVVLQCLGQLVVRKGYVEKYIIEESVLKTSGVDCVIFNSIHLRSFKLVFCEVHYLQKNQLEVVSRVH